MRMSVAMDEKKAEDGFLAAVRKLTQHLSQAPEK